jgi:hypothetical protein
MGGTAGNATAKTSWSGGSLAMASKWAAKPMYKAQNSNCGTEPSCTMYVHGSVAPDPQECVWVSSQKCFASFAFAFSLGVYSFPGSFGALLHSRNSGWFVCDAAATSPS